MRNRIAKGGIFAASNGNREDAMVKNDEKENNLSIDYFFPIIIE